MHPPGLQRFALTRDGPASTPRADGLRRAYYGPSHARNAMPGQHVPQPIPGHRRRRSPAAGSPRPRPLWSDHLVFVDEVIAQDLAVRAAEYPWNLNDGDREPGAIDPGSAERHEHLLGHRAPQDDERHRVVTPRSAARARRS